MINLWSWTLTGFCMSLYIYAVFKKRSALKVSDLKKNIFYLMTHVYEKIHKDDPINDSCLRNTGISNIKWRQLNCTCTFIGLWCQLLYFRFIFLKSGCKSYLELEGQQVDRCSLLFITVLYDITVQTCSIWGQHHRFALYINQFVFKRKKKKHLCVTAKSQT